MARQPGPCPFCASTDLLVSHAEVPSRSKVALCRVSYLSDLRGSGLGRRDRGWGCCGLGLVFGAFSPKPLPCPFCYGTWAQIQHLPHANLFFVRCFSGGCLTEGPIAKTAQEAIEKWNAVPRQQTQAHPSPTPEAPTPEELLKTILQAVPEDERQGVLNFARRLTTPAEEDPDVTP
jgi:hypothetical protein